MLLDNVYKYGGQCMSQIMPLVMYFMNHRHLKDVNINAVDGTAGRLPNQMAAFLKVGSS